MEVVGLVSTLCIVYLAYPQTPFFPGLQQREQQSAGHSTSTSP